MVERCRLKLFRKRNGKKELLPPLEFSHRFPEPFSAPQTSSFPNVVLSPPATAHSPSEPSMDREGLLPTSPSSLAYTTITPMEFSPSTPPSLPTKTPSP